MTKRQSLQNSETETKHGGKDIVSWESIVNFAVLDTKWFKKTEDERCRKNSGRSTIICWKESFKEIIRANSTLLPIAFECIKQGKRKKN
ncbi:unnamed protein product [Clavelina lepadiformis]|uniref:Uncharacterized protein n=1 Tax=Clavelina lepadiformis TaxID=159417 RepID=A0ABP0GYA3_CLALP